MNDKSKTGTSTKYEARSTHTRATGKKSAGSNFVLLASNLAVLCLLLQAEAFSQAGTLAGFDAYVAKAVQDWRTPGLAIAVVKDGQVVFTKGYGVRELGKPQPADTHTLFAIGSTTKAMTAALVGMLVDEKKLGWDDPVVKHLPWFQVKDPYLTREITVRDLLTHRAGFAYHFTAFGELAATNRRVVPRRERGTGTIKRHGASTAGGTPNGRSTCGADGCWTVMAAGNRLAKTRRDDRTAATAAKAVGKKISVMEYLGKVSRETGRFNSMTGGNHE